MQKYNILFIYSYVFIECFAFFVLSFKTLNLKLNAKSYLCNMNLESILKNLQIQELNQMQKSTYKATENNQDVVLLSPTGSGKTLAFLLPVFPEAGGNGAFRRI